MADPCATQRRARDRAAIALGRNQAAIDHATATMQAAAARARNARPPLPGECLEWIDNATSGLSSYELNLFPPPCASHIHGPCGTIWKWAAKRDLAAGQRAQLQADLDAAQAAYAGCIAEHADAAPDPGAPGVGPAGSDDEADGWVDHPQPSDEELDDATPAPAPGDGDTSPVTVSSGRCGAPRTGHGHVGEPCHVLLGEDGACQYHGVA